jgi:four helix bundle protein
MHNIVNSKPDVLRDKTFVFAKQIVLLYQKLESKRKFFDLNKQILRSGTNPGAMVREAAGAESGKDFIHKLSIAQKEIGETIYWLELLFSTDYIEESQYQKLKSDAEEILRILIASIKTKKRNLSNK